MAFHVKVNPQSNLGRDGYYGDRRGDRGSSPSSQPDVYGDGDNGFSSFRANSQGQEGRKKRQRRRRAKSRQRQYDTGDHTDGSDLSDTSSEISETHHRYDQRETVWSSHPHEHQSHTRKKQQSDGKFGAQGRTANQQHTEDEHDDGGSKDRGTAVNDQNQAENSDALPNVDPDESIKISRLLLNRFNGRTKLGTLMSKKGNLLQGFTYTQAATWLRRSKNFLVFAKQEQIKWVSVYSKKARLCFRYKNCSTDRCSNEKCPFFHVCRDFVSGTCPFGSYCGFSHSFYHGSNAVLFACTALQDFEDEEICTITFRSAPAVCDKFNKGACNDDCPDLHVCSSFIRKQCEDENCQFGHELKGTEHNDWVLSTFNMQKLPDPTLKKLVITLRNNSADSCKPDTMGAGLQMKAEACHTTFGSKESLSQMKRTKSGADLHENATGENLTQQKPTQRSQKENLTQQKPTQRSQKENLTQQKPTQRSQKENLTQQKPTQRSQKPQNPHFKAERLEPQKVGTGACAAARQSQPEEKQTMGTKVLSARHRKETQVEQNFPASKYKELCEKHTWTGSCEKGVACPRYHHPDRYPVVWQLHIYDGWHDLSDHDSLGLEERFCALAARGWWEVFLPSIGGGLQIEVDFNAMEASVSDGSGLEPSVKTQIRRWSLPSYVDSEPDSPLNLYSQWLWYQTSTCRHFVPYSSGTLQYTLEEKYLRGQQKYYFEDPNGKRYLVLFKEMKIVDLQMGSSSPILRRPFQPLVDHGASVPLLSSVLMKKPPTIHQTDLPAHWCTVDRYQHFELVELATSSKEYADVKRSFCATLRADRANIVHIFRVQNPSLWDKYCSAKRSMATSEGSVEEVEERTLFHGTSSLLAARGICTNGFDFRRAGSNVGTLYGRGSYFSTTAIYSHSYTKSPHRFMFLAKVLVGQYTKGEPSYTSPPVCTGLKLYGSCVDNVANPTIFVIFDLAQSYPEYLCQYEDGEAASQKNVHTGHGHTAAATAPSPAGRASCTARTGSASYRTTQPSVSSNTPAAVGASAASYYMASRAPTAVGSSGTTFHTTPPSLNLNAPASRRPAAGIYANHRLSPSPPVQRALSASWGLGRPAPQHSLTSLPSRPGLPGAYITDNHEDAEDASYECRKSSSESRRCVIS